jgi:hypothetical protein
MTRAIPVRTLTIFLMKEQVGATEIIDPEEAAQRTETPVSYAPDRLGLCSPSKRQQPLPDGSSSYQNPALTCRGCDEH